MKVERSTGCVTNCSVSTESPVRVRMPQAIIGLQRIGRTFAANRPRPLGHMRFAANNPYICTTFKQNTEMKRTITIAAVALLAGILLRMIGDWMLSHNRWNWVSGSLEYTH